MRAEHFPTVDVEADGGSGEFREHWRQRVVTLVLNETIYAHEGYNPITHLSSLEPQRSPDPNVVTLQRQLFDGVSPHFEIDGSSVKKWRDGDEKLEISNDWMALNVIDLGEVNDKQRRAIEEISVTDEKSFWNFV